MVYKRKSKKAIRHKKRRLTRRMPKNPREEILKWTPAEINPTASLYSGSYYCSSSFMRMSAGDDVGYRQGRNCYIRQMFLNLRVKYDTPLTATQPATVRWFVFQSNDPNIAYTDFNTMSVMDSIDRRYLTDVGKILHRGTTVLTPAEKTGVYRSKMIRVGRWIKYLTTNFNDIVNPIYLLVMTDAVNDVNNKITFTAKFTICYNA